MKSLVKLAGAFALGIIITVTVIVPKLTPKSAETPSAPDIQSENVQMADTAVKAAPTETALVEVSTESVVETEAVLTPESTASTTPELAATSKPTPEPVETETAKVEISSSPQVKQAESAYPKYFYENGQKYAYLDEFHEQQGMKMFVADEGEPNVDAGKVYDWVNDEAGKIKGPFN
jgi:hypothetical protein